MFHLFHLSHSFWAAFLLLTAGLYHLVLSFFLISTQWVSLGWFILVLGLGCLIAAINIYRFWKVLFSILLGEGVLFAYLMGQSFIQQTIFPYAFPMIGACLWMIVFGGILNGLANHKRKKSEHFTHAQSIEDTLKEIKVPHKQMTLEKLSYHRPLLVVFLRYTGCTFCQQTIDDLARNKAELRRQGFKIVLIHLNKQSEVQNLLEDYGLSDVIQITDPNRDLYRAFGVKRASWSELLNIRTLKKAFQVSFIEGYKQGKINGDPFQMSGAFVVYQAKIVYCYLPTFVGDSPNYLKIQYEKHVNPILNTLKQQYE